MSPPDKSSVKPTEMVMLPIIGVLTEFPMNMDWTMYKPRMESFFDANSIQNGTQRRDLFFNSLDDEAFKLTLSVPKEPKGLTFSELLKLFDEYFVPSESLF